MARPTENKIPSESAYPKYRFLAELAADAKTNGLHFQTNAEIDLRILRALEKPEISLSAITRLIGAEPLMSAHIVAVANSAAFRSGDQIIADLQGAVAKLGLDNVRALAIALLVRRMSESPKASPPLQRRMAAQLWEHTAHVAAIAMVLARRITHVPPEAALFAGIVHEVGCFYLLSRATDRMELLTASWPEQGNEAEMELLVQLNRVTAEALYVPAPTMAALEDLWAGYLAIPPRSLGDTLLLADQLAPVASPFCGVPAASQSGSGCGASIEMIVDADKLSAILAESTAEVNSLVDTLLR